MAKNKKSEKGTSKKAAKVEPVSHVEDIARVIQATIKETYKLADLPDKVVVRANKFAATVEKGLRSAVRKAEREAKKAEKVKTRREKLEAKMAKLQAQIAKLEAGS